MLSGSSFLDLPSLFLASPRRVGLCVCVCDEIPEFPAPTFLNSVRVSAAFGNALYFPLSFPLANSSSPLSALMAAAGARGSCVYLFWPSYHSFLSFPPFILPHIPSPSLHCPSSLFSPPQSLLCFPPTLVKLSLFLEARYMHIDKATYCCSLILLRQPVLLLSLTSIPILFCRTPTRFGVSLARARRWA